MKQVKTKVGYTFDLEDRQSEAMHRNSAERSISIDCQTIIKHIQDAPKNSAKAITITYHSPIMPSPSSELTTFNFFEHCQEVQ